ncbi:MAG: recombinase family protein [Ruminococcus sp.]|nr:recombinase family protein [Ruminococcus sp.]
MPLKVAGYCRVSTDKESQINSLENQRTFFTDYINRNNDWILTEIYYDEGVSGTSINRRDGFNRMIDDAYAGKIDLIVTKEVSRFARNTVLTLEYTRRLREKGIGIIFINDNISTLDPDGELRLTIMSGIAQEESRKISERIVWGQKQSMKHGVVFGRSMLGYDVKNGKLYVNSQGAEIVRLIFNKYVNEGKGVHTIARELIGEKIYPMNTEYWSNAVILRILRNEKYVGDLCQQKTYTPDYLNHKKKYNNGEKEKIYIKNHHEPIIDRQTWEQAQKILESHTLTDTQKSRYSNRYWCSGKIVCGVCRKKFVSRTKKTKSGQYKAWRCSAIARDGKKSGCDNNSVNDAVLLKCTAYVLDTLVTDREAILSEIVSEIRTVCDTGGEKNIRNCRKNIEIIENKKRILLDRFLDGTVSVEDYRKQNQYYDLQIAGIQEAKSDNMENISENITDYARKLLEFKDINEYVCSEVLENITVYPDKSLDVKLRYYPAVRLHYSTTGRGKNYTVNIIT